MIYSNSAIAYGAGVYVYGSSVVMYNNTIAQNHNTATGSTSCGAGIHACEGEPSPSVTGYNNILYFNTAVSSPEYCGNVSFTYSCVSTGMTSIGNITQDPMFVDIVHNDFRLEEHSPCIDAGDPNSPFDPDSTRADMGAFYHHQSSGIHTNPTQEVPSEFTLLPNYPNPFNPKTRVTFTISSTSHVNLTIYDITGRKVDVVVDSKVSAGMHQYVWDASGLPTGVYIAHLTANRENRFQKLLLIK